MCIVEKSCQQLDQCLQEEGVLSILVGDVWACGRRFGCCGALQLEKCPGKRCSRGTVQCSEHHGVSLPDLFLPQPKPVGNYFTPCFKFVVVLRRYHINPLSAAVQGGSPINMDTADAAGRATSCFLCDQAAMAHSFDMLLQSCRSAAIRLKFSISILCAGDFMFDMLEEYPFPIECPNGEASPSELCRNLEVAAADLVVTKLTLAAAQPFG